MGPKVGMPRPGERWAQTMKALAQHKDSVTRVTKCQHASCQMTHDQEGTKGEEEQRAYWRRRGKEAGEGWSPLLTAGAGPATPLQTHGPRVPYRTVGHRNCSGPGLEAKWKWQEGTANSRRHREGLF